MKRVTALLALCSVLLMATAAAADIEVNESYKPHEQITVRVTPSNIPAGAMLRGSFQVTSATWDVVSVPNAAALRVAASDLRALIPTVPAEAGVKLATAATEIEKAVSCDTYHVWAGPGSHTISASGIWVLTDTGDLGGKLIDFGMYQYSKEFVVKEGDGPVPPPVPPGTRWAMIVKESSKETPQTGALWVELRKRFQSDRLLIQDKDQLPPSLQKHLQSQPYQKYLSDKGTLPALVVLTGSAVLRVVSCPSSADAVESEVAK